MNGIYEDTDQEHIYYNLRIDNPLDGIDNATDQTTVFDRQTQPIVRKQSDYQVAVEAWSLRAQLPIFIATIEQGTNTNINLMPFEVCYSFTTGGVTTDFLTQLIWTPDPKFLNAAIAPLPKAPNDNNGLQDLLTNPGYYWCTKYQRMVDIINTALTASYTAFNAAHPGIHAAACYVQYDAVTGLFGMVAPTSYATGANPAEVYFSVLLYKYIDTINAEFYGFNRPNSKEYRINFQLQAGEANGWSTGNYYAPGTPAATVTTPPALIIMQQETDCRYLWSNIKQILLTSSSISVRNTYMPFFSNPFQFTNRDFDAFNQNKRSVISYVDYNYASPSPSIQSSLSRDIYYRPTYRNWQELTSDSPLTNVNLEIFYVTEDNFILPLNLPNKASCSVNLSFRKKL